MSRGLQSRFVTICFVTGLAFSQQAYGWWIFNETAELVEKIEQADQDRKDVETARSAAEVAEKLEKARNSTVEAVEAAADLAADFPGTSLTGPPPTSKIDAAIEAVKAVTKWAWRKFWGEDEEEVVQATQDEFPFVPPPSDDEIGESLSSFSIPSSSDYLLTFAYTEKPGFAPLFMVNGEFSAVFAPLSKEGLTLLAEDLLGSDVGIGSPGLLDVLLSYFEAQSPSWDTDEYLSHPELYQDAMTVVIDQADNSTGAVHGRFVYFAVGPFVEVPEPGTLALFGLGLAGIGAVRRKKLAA